MANHRTAELSGPLLDAAVAKAQKHSGIAIREAHCYVNWHVRDGLGAGDAFSPSSAWGCGGPILQSAGVNVLYSPARGWRAGFEAPGESDFRGRMAHEETGDTPLVASMRAYVARELGESVDLDA